MVAIRVLAVIVAAFGAIPSLAAEGAIEVRVTDHAAGIASFAALEVSLAEVAVHIRGAPRQEGWTIVAEQTVPVDIVPLKRGRWAAIARTRLGAGAYDLVRVRFGALDGRPHEGPRHAVVGDDATAAAQLLVPPDELQAILIDLYVEDQTDHEPQRFAVKLRRVDGRHR
jgi:hypothetical protein